MAVAVKELFEAAVDVAGRGFPSEAAAREGLESFTNALHESKPIDSVMKRLFGRAAVRQEEGAGGERVFKIFLHSGDPAEKSILPVIRRLRVGDLESVARALDMTPAELGSRAFRENYAAYVRDIFPDIRVAEELAAAERALPASLASASRELRPETAEALLHAMKRDDGLNRLVSKLAEHIVKNGGARFRYVSTFLVLSGVTGSVAAVALALHEQAKRASGCWRVYLDPVTKQLRGCKILQASCRHRDANEGTACDRTPLSFDASMCRGAGPNDECVHCDPTAETNGIHHISPSQYLEPNDMYICKPVASVGEMLGKIIADVPDLAVDAVGDVMDTVANAWNSVKYFLLAAGAIGVSIMLFVLYLRVGRGRVRDDDTDGYGGFERRPVGKEGGSVVPRRKRS